MNPYKRFIRWLARYEIEDLKAAHSANLRDQREEIVWHMQNPSNPVPAEWPLECLFIGGVSDGRRMIMNGEPYTRMAYPRKAFGEAGEEDEAPRFFPLLDKEEFVRETISINSSKDNAIHLFHWYRHCELERVDAIKKLFSCYKP